LVEREKFISIHAFLIKMNKQIKYLRKQLEEVVKKYEEFRRSPEDEVGIREREYMDALDVLGHMRQIYEKKAGRRPTKEEQVFLDLIRDRSVLENVIRGDYDMQHDLLDDSQYVDLERAEEIRRAAKGSRHDLENVLKDLGINPKKE